MIHVEQEVLTEIIKQYHCPRVIVYTIVLSDMEVRILLMLLMDVISEHVPSLLRILGFLLVLLRDVIFEHVPSLLWRLGCY